MQDRPIIGFLQSRTNIMQASVFLHKEMKGLLIIHFRIYNVWLKTLFLQKNRL